MDGITFHLSLTFIKGTKIEKVRLRSKGSSFEFYRLPLEYKGYLLPENALVDTQGCIVLDTGS